MPIINPNVYLPEDEKNINMKDTPCLCSGMKVNGENYMICIQGNILCSAARISVHFTLSGIPAEQVVEKTLEGLMKCSQ